MPSSLTSAEDPTPGGRGGAWVVAQFALMGALVAAGFLPPAWPDQVDLPLSLAGIVLVPAGGALALWAARLLGRSLTVFPKPVEAGLVTRGPFAVVRHPIYTGGLVLFSGYALLTSVPALALTAALAVLWAGKLRVEERLLAAVYDGYPAYCERIRWRLVPLMY